MVLMNEAKEKIQTMIDKYEIDTIDIDDIAEQFEKDILELLQEQLMRIYDKLLDNGQIRACSVLKKEMGLKMTEPEKHICNICHLEAYAKINNQLFCQVCALEYIKLQKEMY